jgi:DNA-binding protein HU-beta
MNKKQLAAAVASSSGLTGANAAKVVDAIIDSIGSALKKEDDVRLFGFGTFSIAKRPDRQGRNPRTGNAIKIAASKAVKFAAGKTLKDAVKG